MSFINHEDNDANDSDADDEGEKGKGKADDDGFSITATLARRRRLLALDEAGINLVGVQTGSKRLASHLLLLD